MKRVLVLIAFALFVRESHVASARVVMTPTIPRTCREAESWDKVMKCVERFGEAKVTRELPGAKLVVLTKPKYQLPGVYLYREKGKRWVIAGMFEANGTFEVFALSKPTIAKHTGYRFDLGIVEDTTGEGGKSLIQQKVSVFCPGDSYSCSSVTTSCDYLVDGRARESFRGKLAIKGDTATVTGDTSHSGTMCGVPLTMSLEFAQQTELRGDPLF